jgi:glyoxylase-like metal-dependent hydrolase (beta-lactamase superfamily II)
MVKEIYPGIFIIKLPLPDNPLREINSYFIPGERKNLMIDTGMNRPECVRVMISEMKEIGIRRGETDVFITHLHADHLGLAPFVSGGMSDVYLGRRDVDLIGEKEYWSDMFDFAVRNGFPGIDPREAIRRHPGYRFGPLGDMKMRSVVGGERFIVGDFDLETVFTPGHSKGHMCLYERNKRLLFSGDHILDDITPNISLWSEDGNPLADYIGSLSMTRDMEVDLVFPGHRRVIQDHRSRIDELIKHHRQREQEILKILDCGDMNGFDVASRMRWDLTGGFDEFPLMQKWFALGEALAHLRFLESKSEVTTYCQNSEIRYGRI